MKILNEVYNKRYCPNCKADLRGEDIYRHFLKSCSEEEAYDIAQMYGYTHKKPKHFYDTIAVETSQYDGATWFMCPECTCLWKRFEWADEKFLEGIL